MDCLKDAKEFTNALRSVYKENGSKRLYFNPYMKNGGTIAAIAGPDFCVLAGDTRLSANDMVIMSRKMPKLFKMTSKCFLAAAGFYGDIQQLSRVLRTQIQKYSFTYGVEMDIHSVAQMTARTLYNKRFFPYYTGILLGGVDSNRNGVLYGYDPIGCLELFEGDMYSSQGEASYLIEPFLDNQIGWKTQPQEKKVPITLDRATSIVHDAFVAATEREKSTGDNLQVVCIGPGPDATECNFTLRRD